MDLSEHKSGWKVRFGKYKGRALASVPSDYLAWGVETLTDDGWEDVRERFSYELAKRKAAGLVNGAKAKEKTRPRQKQRRKPKRQRTQTLSEKAKHRPVTLLPPYAQRHPVPADWVIDPNEECPFDADDVPYDESLEFTVNREFREVVG